MKNINNRHHLINRLACTLLTELNAAQLKSIDESLQKRKVIDTQYREGLADVKGIHCLANADEQIANYSYFPILVQPDYALGRDALYQKLKDNGIYARR